MIPNFIRFGYSLNAWIWFPLLIIVMKFSYLFEKSIEYHETWLIEHSIVPILILTAMLIEMTLTLYLTRKLWKLEPPEDEFIRISGTPADTRIKEIVKDKKEYKEIIGLIDQHIGVLSEYEEPTPSKLVKWITNKWGTPKKT